MEVATSLISSTYGKYSVPRGVGPKAKNINNVEAAQRKKQDDSIDKIDLSKGLSLERINSLLTTEIGKKVDRMLAEAGIDLGAAAGLDWSPEATAGRIFDMTTGLFEIWRSQHPEQSEEELTDSFENVIRTSVDKGASEAIAILGAGGIDDGVISVAKDTMSILHEKYDDFFLSLRSNLEKEAV